MYIKKVQITNFRNFKNKEIEFNNGVNAIIGHNNAGKSNVIDAVGLVINNDAKRRLTIDDFSKTISLDELKANPPHIEISLFLHESEKENDIDLDIVGTWLIKIESPYIAQLTYCYFLPEKYKQKYMELVKDAESTNEALYVIKTEFLRLYTYKIWGGNPELMNTAESEKLQKFSFQYLDAIRDVERDMTSGKNKLLKTILEFFIDYEIKNEPNYNDEQKTDELRKIRKEFIQETDKVTKKLLERLEAGKGKILSYAKNIGAAFNGANPNFSSIVSEEDLLEILKLVVDYPDGISIPASRNGLGYNNLIFMSLLLSKMQIDANGDYLGSNAKLFPILAIEEPEAHLHPSMQRQFINFMRNNVQKGKVRQVFITTHSTHIASTLDLDEILCLYNIAGETSISYIGNVFTENKKSKSYVQRFFDATKTDMLFADKVLFVEGLAEQLLFSTLASYTEHSFEKEHVSIVNVNGKYFEHFLKMFDSIKSGTLNKKVACVTDIDPCRKKRGSNEKYKKCYPVEMYQNERDYEYKINDSLSQYAENNHPNIASYTQNEKGKTLEYEIAYYNPQNELILVEGISNKSELKDLMRKYRENKSIDEMLDILSQSNENERIKEGINNSDWDYDEKAKSIISSRYLNSVGKGENALELMYVLRDNLAKKDTEEFIDFNVPQYIKDAVKWVCE